MTDAAQEDRDRLDHEAHELVIGAVDSRSIDTAKAAGERLGRVVGLIYVGIPWAEGQASFHGGYDAVRRTVAQRAVAQGIPYAEADALCRAIFSGLAAAALPLINQPGGRA